MPNRSRLLFLLLLLMTVVLLTLLLREPALDGPTGDSPVVSPESMDVVKRPPRPSPGPAAEAPAATVEAGPPDARIDAPGARENAALLPPGHPASRVPHRVLKSWGRDYKGRPTGAIGFSIVVDPAISNAELSELARDVLEANEDAEVMSVRIYDSEEATSQKWHETHDPRIQEHTIGKILVNWRIGLRQVKIREEAVDVYATEP